MHGGVWYSKDTISIIKNQQIYSPFKNENITQYWGNTKLVTICFENETDLIIMNQHIKLYLIVW